MPSAGMRPCRPTNFSWIVEGLLAGCAFPSHGGHFQYLLDSGIQHLVTLTEYTPPLQLLPSGQFREYKYCINGGMIMLYH